MARLLGECSLAEGVRLIRRRLGDLEAAAVRLEEVTQANADVDLMTENTGQAKSTLTEFGTALDPLVTGAQFLSEDVTHLNRAVSGFYDAVQNLQRQRGEEAQKAKEQAEKEAAEKAERLREASRIRALLAESEPAATR